VLKSKKMPQGGLRLDKVTIAVFMKETHRLLLEGQRFEAAAAETEEEARLIE